MDASLFDSDLILIEKGANFWYYVLRERKRLHRTKKLLFSSNSPDRLLRPGHNRKNIHFITSLNELRIGRIA